MDLFSRPGVPDGLVSMQKCETAYRGNGYGNRVTKEASIKDSNTKETPSDPSFEVLVDTSCQVSKTRGGGVLEQRVVQKAMKDAFEVFVNKNVGKFPTRRC